MINLLSKSDNTEFVTISMLQRLRVQVHSSTVKKTLNDHPEYPSLLSISESLTEWHVPNQAFKIDKEDFDPKEIRYPFIAHFNTNGGNFLLVHKIEGNKVYYSNNAKRDAVIGKDDFLLRWTGIGLMASSDEKSGEKDYPTNLMKGRLNSLKVPATVIIALASLYLILDMNTFATGYSILLLLKLIGLTVGILLLMHSIDANNPLIQNLCSLGNKNNCNAILKSEAANVTPWLTWSEVGFFYFSGSFLSMLINPANISLLVWLNLLSLPYTVYSLSYQYRKNNWCVLCCSVQALLWLEFICINSFLPHPYALQASTKDAIPFMISFISPILIWAFIKPYLKKSSEQIPLKKQLKKFKYNSELFQQVLKNQPRYAVPEDIMPITLGNPNAETTITIVSNPMCGPCGKAHQTLDDWLSYRDDIRLKVVFATSDKDNEERTLMARHASALSLLDDKDIVEEALRDWFSIDSKFETWSAKYPVDCKKEMKGVTEKQKAWCDMAEIKYTPTILVNGYKLPEPYRLEDIKYLLS